MKRRELFQGKVILLPRVLHADGDQFIELDYQRHILPAIDWDVVKDFPRPPGHAARSTPPGVQSATVDVGAAPAVIHAPEELYIDKTISIAWFARRLSDVVPNAWQGARYAQALIERLRSSGADDDHIFDRRADYAYALREHVKEHVERQSEAICSV